ncbi:hypothetical protein T492DRAFT_1107352 [Pavlovales sp. CCMP2436]|nr:hypothetical protein T492DRAFT_1107352 [Pavlovales sp. CCMP2436]
MMLTLGLFMYVALLDVLCKLAGDLTILEGVRRLGFAMWAAQSFMATGLVLAVAAAVGVGAARLYTYMMGLLVTMVVSALCVALFIVALSAANRVILVANQMQLDHIWPIQMASSHQPSVYIFRRCQKSHGLDALSISLYTP